MPDPTQPPASFVTLAGGLHATAAVIRHDGHQHGIQLSLTPLGARVLLGLPAGELATTVVALDTLLGPVAGELVDRLRSARTSPGRSASSNCCLLCPMHHQQVHLQGWDITIHGGRVEFRHPRSSTRNADP